MEVVTSVLGLVALILILWDNHKQPVQQDVVVHPDEGFEE